MDEIASAGSGLRRGGQDAPPPAAPKPEHVEGMLEKMGPKRPLHRPWTYWELRMEDKKQVRYRRGVRAALATSSVPPPTPPPPLLSPSRAWSGATTR